MSGAAAIVLDGERLVALKSGALYWPDRETLVVSDLHFEKGSHFATKGVLLPPYDTRTTLRRLQALIKERQPKTVISLGDAFHDGASEARMDKSDADALAALVGSTRWIWILGNHDPEPPQRFAGAVERTFRLGRLLFRHEPGAETGEIAGHLHPAARIRADARIMRRRCFASDGKRLIMPAFGAYTGGLNILDPAYDGLFRADLTAFVMGAAGVYAFSRSALLPDVQLAGRRAAVG
jgi:DNA ligase-associated metallophosphoesterase